MTEKEFGIVEWWLREAMEYGEERHNEPYEKAIQALEEIQQYHELGTIMEIIGQQYELQTFHAIGTIEEFKALKEKSAAKEIINKGQGHESDCYCPNCNKFLGDDQDWCFNQTKYCSECGQAFKEY